ncbi:carbohydrate ABC transporter permease [Phytoactinopolyspora limicola]|uniref:carbohydrate ABC transporter permease n=1 Tax=Phytoactinopolyspora limicola TaxID=2715536 RepID=UPI001A9C28DB|nr:sugar ABC transporter permease [Phytoactinopolyspora limicola]
MAIAARNRAGAPAPVRRRWWRSDKAVIAYVFILPYVILFLTFKIAPAIFGVGLSFTNWRPVGGADFIGFDNFTRLFSDPIFWGALRVTLVYAIIAIPMSITVSLFMALLCDRTLRGMGIYRSIFFLPVVTSSVIAGIIWVWIFGQQGPLNWLTGLVGVGPLGWLQSEILVLPALSMVSAWSNFGYNMLILLAGMLAIPRDYYEAAELDGANWFKRFRHVTIPLLKPALFFVLILEIIKSFQVFDTIYVMTGGGPFRSSYTLTYMIYDQGFGYFDFGYASAVGVVLLVITLAVSLVQRWLFDKEKKK